MSHSKHTTGTIYAKYYVGLFIQSTNNCKPQPFLMIISLKTKENSLIHKLWILLS